MIPGPRYAWYPFLKDAECSYESSTPPTLRLTASIPGAVHLVLIPTRGSRYKYVPAADRVILHRIRNMTPNNISHIVVATNEHRCQGYSGQ